MVPNISERYRISFILAPVNFFKTIFILMKYGNDLEDPVNIIFEAFYLTFMRQTFSFNKECPLISLVKDECIDMGQFLVF